jgi:hypothetical protein
MLGLRVPRATLHFPRAKLQLGPLAHYRFLLELLQAGLEVLSQFRLVLGIWAQAVLLVSVQASAQ